MYSKMKAWDVRRGDTVLYEFNHLVPDVEFLEAHRSSFYEASSASSLPLKDRQEGDDPHFDGKTERRNERKESILGDSA